MQPESPVHLVNSIRTTEYLFGGTSEQFANVFGTGPGSSANCVPDHIQNLRDGQSKGTFVAKKVPGALRRNYEQTKDSAEDLPSGARHRSSAAGPH